MPTFLDNKQREWNIAIDAPKILAIRADCDPLFLLNDVDENNTYGRMQTDPVLLCRVVFLLCAQQRESRQVSEEDFYMEVIGDAIDRATEALLAAIVNFTPQRSRELLEAVANKEARVQQQATELALAKINDPNLEQALLEKIGQRIDAELKAAMQPLNVTSLPDSSASRQEG